MWKYLQISKKNAKIVFQPIYADGGRLRREDIIIEKT